MTLSPDQRSRVAAALEAESGADALAAVGRMESAEELHATALELNWDDGFLVPDAILRHPGCERGTALHLYYGAQGPWSAPEGVSATHAAFLAKARERLLSGQLPEKVVSYDPAIHWNLDRVQLLKLRKAGLPEALLRACGPR